MEGTLPPSCKNHGANIGSVRYRQAAMRVTDQRIAARYAAIPASPAPRHSVRPPCSAKESDLHPLGVDQVLSH